MDFAWSREQVELYESSLAFASARLNRAAAERERAQEFGREEWQSVGEYGLLGASLPERYGGRGLDALTTARVFEAFGRGCLDTGLLVSAAAHLFACAMPLAAYGTAELKDTWLVRLASGAAIGANAITEPEAGSDVFALQTRAIPVAGGYRLSGIKSYVSNAPIADLVLVYAVTEPADGYLGLSAFAVARDTPGLTIGKPMDKLGLTTAPMSAIYLDDCLIPASHRLGDEGQGAAIFQHSMQWERTCLFAIYLGVMERTIEQAIAYAQERRQSGKTIGKFQAVSHRIADMKLRLDSARLLLYRACWMHDQGQGAELETALAKLAISEAAIESAIDAIRIHGGAGTLRETGIERSLRDAVPGVIFSGTSEIQRNLIARAMGL